MYLKYLELQGFKSFPDKIRLTFDKGLTAVVGPNGSGKSNIGDSVRWVLGEQSTKTLRGNKMEDVIFSGTVGRKPMGFAAVTLVIDNSEGRLEGYGDEVSVTRKLYRSGESEYRINGKSVRLKDINELFMDTGLGRDGYSIIGQGRIAEIVGQKSNERREIFEEAAGISKFRYRKTEAERKLQQAQDNMDRLSDIVGELESRVGPLKHQAEKAEKFLVLAQEQKTLEISVWVEQLTALQTRLQELDEKLLLARANYEETERQIEGEEEKIQACYRVMQTCSVEAEEARNAVRELQDIASQAKSDIAVWKNDIVHNEEALKLSQTRHAQELQEQDKLISRLEEAEQQADAAGKVLLETQQALSEAQTAFEKMEAAYREEDEKSRDADEALHRLYLERSELQFGIRSAEGRCSAVQADMDAAERESTERVELLSAAEKAYEAALQEMQRVQQEVTEQERRMEEYRKNLKALQQAKTQAEDAFRQSGFALREKKQRHRILTDLENSMEGFSGSVKTLMKAVRNGGIAGICGTVAQLIQVDSRYGVAVETALGASVQHLIVEDENSAKAGIRYLKDNRAGRATFLPLTSIRGRRLQEQGLEGQKGFVAVASDLVQCEPEYRQIAENLLGRIVIAEDIDRAAAIAKRYGYRFRIVTMDGQVVNAGGSFTGGSVQKTGGMLTRRTELKSLQEEIEQLALQCRDSEQEARKAADASLSAERELEKESRHYAALQQSFLQAQTEAERQAFPVSQYRQKASELEERMKSLLEQAGAAEQAAAAARLAYDTKVQEIERAEQGLTGAKDRRTQLLEERDALSAKYGDLKIRLAEAEKDREAANAALNLAQEAVEQADQRDEQYRAELEGYRATIRERTDAVQMQEQRLAETVKAIAEAEEKARTASKSHDAQNIRIRELQSGLNEYHTAKEKLSAEVTRLSEREESLKSENDSIITKLLEVYEMTRSEAQAAAQPIEDMTDAKKRLSELKQKIRALGSVNVDAIEEYREVLERYKFLSGQMADVRKSKSELERLIGELTVEMCRIFSESFTIINRNFKEIFTELFGGGKAELKLTDPDNVLTSGIEINVAPPGKVIKNLISLSGGEQSFVAIAIYFAILRLRPAPFCILDEIDAALDEANVRKYARYLHRFTDNTQFVLVTHRRSAMEEANILYGVTMQEDGISRLLKLEQPEEPDELGRQ
ncbi:MAG: chromosome segregation protein SMC [Oscillospiraceae bacterium]|nr:chromosome segregation protein SMC [Oscillospiraceae bacterium]